MAAVFKDSNTGFRLNRRPDIVVDSDAIIYSSFMNLFGTIIGQRSRIGQPEYGSRIRQYLQEPIVPATAKGIEMDMLESVRRWEPRIQMDRSESYVRVNMDLPGYQIRLAFRMQYGNTKDLHAVEFDLTADTFN